MSEERNSFLSRWSKRKLEERQPRTYESLEGGGAEAELPHAADSELELTPEEIEALPNIDDLTAESDVTIFLRKGVPDMLRKAALRRMWSIDPAIRDHVGDARDYAYDWNVLGGVPGNGPLLPTDDVDSMLRQVFARKTGSQAAQAPELKPSDVSQESEREPLPRAEASGAAEVPEPAEREEDGSYAALQGVENQSNQEIPLHGSGSVASPFRDSPEGSPIPRNRRHGRAKPV